MRKRSYLLRVHRCATILAALCAFIGLSAETTFGAGLQRMGLAPGVINLAGGAAQSVEAFCYDLTRDSPNAAARYTNVLSVGVQATVNVGGSAVSLQDAIASGEVIIRGSQSTMEQLMEEASNPVTLHRFPKADQAELQQMAHEWHQLPPEAKTRIERALAARFAAHGDFRRLVFINNDRLHRPMSISIGPRTIVGGSGDTAPDAIAAQGTHSIIQDTIWREQTLRHQRLLTEAGFYRSKPNGNFDEVTELGVGAFQDAHGLPVTGHIDGPTEQQLRASAQDQRFVGQINASASPYLLGIVQTQPALGIRYRVLMGDGTVGYVGNSGRDLTAKMQHLATDNKVNSVFLVTDGMPQDRAVALRSTVKNTHADHPDQPDVVVLTDRVHPLSNDTTFGHKVTAIIDDGSEPAVTSTGKATKTVALVDEHGRIVGNLTVVGKTKEIVKAFIANLKVMLAQIQLALRLGQPIGNLHAADIVTLALNQTQRDAGLTRKQMYELIQVQFGGVELSTRPFNLISIGLT